MKFTEQSTMAGTLRSISLNLVVMHVLHVTCKHSNSFGTSFAPRVWLQKTQILYRLSSLPLALSPSPCEKRRK